jgi:Pyruvate/2-oxoacid:ferredoxin oxidoreductase delta subunit
MAVRNIVQIDEEKCNGCGQCASACAEGAIKMINGKARLVKDEYCDGLGACLGECPVDAIKIIQRDAPEFDEVAVEEYLKKENPQKIHVEKPHSHGGGGCPGMAMKQFFSGEKTDDKPLVKSSSALRQWPIQLHLVSPMAPYFRDADLLLAADCTAFALGSFHPELLADHSIAIACPKLDETDGYVEKISQMITHGGIRSLTIAIMQVPCCRGLEVIAMKAVEKANIPIPVRLVIVGIEGDIVSDVSKQ